MLWIAEQSYELALLQLVRSRVIKFICPKNDYLKIVNDPNVKSDSFFLPVSAGIFQVNNARIYHAQIVKDLFEGHGT